MKASLSNFDTENLLRTLSSHLGVEVNKGYKQYAITLPPHVGKGAITSFRFIDGLSLFLFEASLKQNWDWEFQCSSSSPLYILFLLEGTVEDHRHEEHERFVLKPMETLMVVHPAGPRRSIVFPAGGRISLAVLRIDQEHYLQSRGLAAKDLPENVQLLFSMQGTGLQQLYAPNRSSIEAAILVNDIHQCKLSGLLRSCYIEAKARELLSLKLQRTADDPDGNFTSPPKIDKITQARDILICDLKNAPTIEVLSKKVGINRQKLKQDFKQVFGKTIFQYLREERMMIAKYLLVARPELSIRQVALEVGYENVSHFSRRFKEQHGLLPSQMQNFAWRKDQEN
jgi:AraC-like DNA-binding protein